MTLILIFFGLWDARGIRRSHGTCASRDIGLMASQRLLVWAIALGIIDVALIPAARVLAAQIVASSLVLVAALLLLRRESHRTAHDARG